MTKTSQDTKSIVLIDDNLFTSARVASSIRSSGHQVLVAKKIEAIESCDIALINLGSRSLGGIEMIAPLRHKFPDAKILGFCGHLETEIRRLARASGIDKLLTNESVAALAWLNEPSDPAA